MTTIHECLRICSRTWQTTRLARNCLSVPTIKERWIRFQATCGAWHNSKSILEATVLKGRSLQRASQSQRVRWSLGPRQRLEVQLRLAEKTMETNLKREANHPRRLFWQNQLRSHLNHRIKKMRMKRQTSTQLETRFGMRNTTHRSKKSSSRASYLHGTR